MEIIDIERLVRRGAASLAESLHFYWPSAKSENEAPERNISLHIAHAFMAADFFAYAEAHTRGRSDLFLDLLLLHPTAKVSVIAEFKRLWRNEEAENMLKDVARLRTFEMQPVGLHHPNLRIDRRFGLLAAITWERKYAQWFTTTSATAPDPTAGQLNELKKALPTETIWNAYPLKSYHDGTADVDRRHWLVYAVFPLDHER